MGKWQFGFLFAFVLCSMQLEKLSNEEGQTESVILFSKVWDLPDSTLVDVHIRKRVSCTEVLQEQLRLVKLGSRLKGFYLDRTNRIIKIDSLPYSVVDEIVALERYCKSRSWHCVAGYGGQEKTEVIMQLGKQQTRFVYCNSELAGFDKVFLFLAGT